MGLSGTALRVRIRRWWNAPKRRLYERLHAEHVEHLAYIGVSDSPLLQIYAERIREFSR
jgi:hypothetical protein